MSIIPLGNRALVKAITVEKDYGIEGFIVSEITVKDKPEKYEVVAIGTGESIDELGLQVGDTVIINKYAGSDTKYDEKSFKIVRADDIQAKVE